MHIENFKVKHKRPTKLNGRSDEYTREAREKLVAIPDNLLTGREFNYLLGVLPAGTYEETVYFLPLAFQYINRNSIPDLDLIVPLISFVSRNSEHLSKDHLLEDSRNCVKELLTTWTSKFDVVHLDEAACKARGYGIKHDDWVQNAQAIEMLIGELVRNQTHQDLAEEFVSELASPIATPIQAAWFLEYASTNRRSPYLPKKNELIMRLLYDQNLRRYAAEVVRQHIIPNESSPTYWRDTFRKLNLYDML